MVQITLVKSREVTVVALVHALHRRSCRGAAWLRGSAGLQKYLLDSPHAHSGPALHLASPGPSCICSCTAAWLVPTLPAVHSEKLPRLLKERRRGGPRDRRGSGVMGMEEVTGRSLSHCRHPSLFWTRPAWRSTPSSGPPGSAGNASTSRGQKRTQTGERSEEELKWICFANWIQF